MQPVRHFEEGNIDEIYIFICYLAYLVLALYKHHLGVTGCSLYNSESQVIRRGVMVTWKTTLDFRIAK